MDGSLLPPLANVSQPVDAGLAAASHTVSSSYPPLRPASTVASLDGPTCHARFQHGVSPSPGSATFSVDQIDQRLSTTGFATGSGWEHQYIRPDSEQKPHRE